MNKRWIFALLIIAASIFLLHYYLYPKNASNENKDIKSDDYRLLSVFWHRQSAEYRALAYQAFNSARMIIDRQGRAGANDAIITDVDDTIITTSHYQAWLVKEGKEFPLGWLQWLKEENSEPVPGACEFLNHASSLGYTIFYISNRDNKTRDLTIADFKRLGFPLNSRDQLLLQKGSEGKYERRKKVLQRYSIKLIIGDNIEDFSHLFTGKDNSLRRSLVDSMKKDFGSRFIILPNAMYGSWLFQVLKGETMLNAEMKAHAVRRSLEE